MDERLENLGKTPVSEGAPAGENAKYEEEYEQLVAELGKLESVSAGGGVDWSLVVDLSSDILEKKSKDILVSCYLAHGLYQQQGLSGLQAGMKVISDMLETYYDDMFPPLKRVKARANALTWLAEKTEPLVAALDPKVKDFELFDTCLSSVNAIQEICDEKMADNGPSLGAFKRSIKNWRDHLKAEVDKLAKEQEKAQQAAQQKAEANETQASQPAQSQTQTAPAPKASVAPVVSVSDVNDDKDVKAAIKSVQDIGRKIAIFKRQANLADPVAYSLLRTTVWMQLERLPPSDNGVTQLPEIDPDRQRLLQNLLDNGDYPNLVNGAESAFCDAMFWLTAHRFTASALDALGHEKAKNAVCQGVAAFLTNFPGITELKFVSGTPFVDEMTRLWIDEQVLGQGSGSGAGGTSANPWDSGLQEALSLAGKGKAQEGIVALRSGMTAARDEREKFMWQLASGEFLTKTGHVSMAVPQLEYLWNQMVARNLSEWESSASVALAKSLLACYDNKNFKKEMNDERIARYQDVKSVMYRLDMDAVLVTDTK